MVNGFICFFLAQIGVGGIVGFGDLAKEVL